MRDGAHRGGAGVMGFSEVAVSQEGGSTFPKKGVRQEAAQPKGRMGDRARE